MREAISRREILSAAAAAAVVITAGPATLLAETPVAIPSKDPLEPFGYCLNTSTIRGQNLPLPQEVEVAAKAGYAAIEPWIPKMDDFVKAGGSLKDLGKQIKDAGLLVPSAIGFAEWIVDDDDRRAKGLEHMKRDMDSVAQIGGTRVAAPPIGAQETGGISLLKSAERYHALCELGKQMGVVPQMEVWGFSKQIRRLGEAACVAIESHHPDACILADIYHLYKGGSQFEGLKLLNGAKMHVMHVNDYPGTPNADAITDAARVFPGEGVAPLNVIFKTLNEIGYRGYLSLELFNESYYKQDALTVAKTGLEKTKAAVRKALS